jgi:hypothetical protein
MHVADFALVRWFGGLTSVFAEVFKRFLISVVVSDPFLLG